MKDPRRRKAPLRKLTVEAHGAMHELNITPLLDLVFVLLVIFIITTPQMANDLEMNLPTGQKKQQNAQPPKIHRIVVATDGSILVDRQAVATNALKNTLVSIKQSEGEPSVVVSGGDSVDYDRVIFVLDVLQQADITKVGLATETAR